MEMTEKLPRATTDCCSPDCCAPTTDEAPTIEETQSADEVRQQVMDRYAAIAVGTESSCCGPEACTDLPSAAEAAQALGYSADDLGALPEGANLGLGCGNPKALAALQPGETVLDLGSGGGIDCFLAGEAVGSTGHVIGVDMTPEMIHKARANAEAFGLPQVEFRLGEIEHLPIADDTVDVILSNCVINLSPDKPAVFREAFRVLKPGGRLAIADVVASVPLPPEIRQDLSLYTGCIAGAAEISDLEAMLTEVGFTDIRIRPKVESASFIRTWVPGGRVEDYVVSATIEGIKPT